MVTGADATPRLPKPLARRWSVERRRWRSFRSSCPLNDALSVPG
jgi:hypothetical protein